MIIIVKKRIFIMLVGINLREPISNMENGMVVLEQRSVMRNRITSHYCSLFSTVVHIQTNTIYCISRIFSRSNICTKKHAWRDLILAKCMSRLIICSN